MRPVVCGEAARPPHLCCAGGLGALKGAQMVGEAEGSQGWLVRVGKVGQVRGAPTAAACEAGGAGRGMAGESATASDSAAQSAEGGRKRRWLGGDNSRLGVTAVESGGGGAAAAAAAAAGPAAAVREGGGAAASAAGGTAGAAKGEGKILSTCTGFT
jgi:hypothetical protein